MWRCTQCETLNDDQNMHCIICGGLRAEQERQQSGKESPPHDSTTKMNESVSEDIGIDPYDEWVDDDGVDPYDATEPKDAFIHTVIWILVACIILSIFLFPDLKHLFVKRVSDENNVIATAQFEEEHDDFNWITSTIAVRTAEPPEEFAEAVGADALAEPTEELKRPTAHITSTPRPTPKLWPTATPTPAPITHVTAERSSYIHARSDASTVVLGELKEGEYIKFEGTKTTGADGYVWYKVEHNQKYGWVSSEWTKLARANEVPLYCSFDYSCVIEDNDCTSFFYWDDYYGEYELYDEGGYEDWYDFDYEVECSIYTIGDVNMRSGPGKDYSILATIKKDTIVTYLDEYSVDDRGVTWYLVLYNGREGWVSSKYAVLG